MITRSVQSFIISILTSRNRISRTLVTRHATPLTRKTTRNSTKGIPYDIQTLTYFLPQTIDDNQHDHKHSKQNSNILRIRQNHRPIYFTFSFLSGIAFRRRRRAPVRAYEQKRTQHQHPHHHPHHRHPLQYLRLQSSSPY